VGQNKRGVIRAESKKRSAQGETGPRRTGGGKRRGKGQAKKGLGGEGSKIDAVGEDNIKSGDLIAAHKKGRETMGSREAKTTNQNVG